MKVQLKKLLYFYIALYPIIPVYLGIGSISLYVYFNLFFAAIFMVYSAKSFPKIFNRHTIFFLIYVLTLMLSNFVHNNYIYVVKNFASLLLIAIAIICFIRTEEALFGGIDILINVGFIVGILGIIESITHFNLFSILNTMGGILNYNELRLGMMRILSFTSQTITYANYASMIACLAFYRIMTSTGKKKKYFKIAYIVLFCNVILTFSRSIILVFLFSQILLYMYCGFWKFLKNLFLGICALSIPIIILYFNVSGFQKAINDFTYMFFAVFDESYVNKVSGVVDNTAGVGHRLLLYEWVWSAVKNDLLFGLGLTTKFAYDLGGLIKTSIEVQYLYTLFHSGILVMISEIFVYLSAMISSLIFGKKRILFCENKLTFGNTCFVLFLGQAVSYFAVMQDIVDRTFYIIMFLLFAFIINIARRDNSHVV